MPMNFLKSTEINNHAMNLVEEKQLIYGIIYSLSSVELQIFKTYIETYLWNRFINLWKSLVGALLFLIKSKTEAFVSTSIIQD